MRKYSSITYRYLKGQKKRTTLTIVGIVLSVALITAIGTMLVTMRGKWIDDAIKEKGHYHAKFIQVHGEKVNKINNNVNVDNISVTNEVGTSVISSVSKEERNNNSFALSRRYLDIKAYDNRALGMLPINIKKGRLPKNENEIILEYWTLDYFPGKPKIGYKIKLSMGNRRVKEIDDDNKGETRDTFTKTGEKEYTIVGIIESKFSWPGGYYAKGITFLDENNLEKDKKYEVYAKMNSVKDVNEKSEEIAKSLNLKGGKTLERPENHKVEYNENLLRLYAESLNESANKGLIAVVTFIVVLIIISTAAVIYNILNISVLERISQFGILRCTGASPRQIKKLVLKEALILSAIGIPLGLASGVLAMEIVIGIVKILVEQEIKIVISPIVFIIGIILGLVTIYLSAIGPARRASKVSPLEAARNTGSLKKENLKKVRKFKIIYRIFGIEGQIAYKNLRRNKKKFRVTVFSLVISIVLYIVFGSFASLVFKMGAVKENDIKDFMVWRNGNADREINASTCDEIAKLKDVEKVYKVMRTNKTIPVSKEKVNPKLLELRPHLKSQIKNEHLVFDGNILISYEDNILPELKRYLKDGTVDKETLNNENGVIIIKTNRLYDNDTKKTTMLDAVDLKVGDEIKILNDNYSENSKSNDKEDTKTVKVVGILEKGILENKYNYNSGIILITSNKVYKKLTGNNHIDKLFVQLKKDHNKDNVADYLKTLNKKDPRYQYVDAAEQSKENRHRAIAINIFLYGFVVVISLIGCLNIINTISTNLMLRKRELAMMMAVGMDKFKMNKMVCIEGICYGVIASLYGAVIGTALSYKLFTLMTNFTDFQWVFPGKQILTAALGAIIISLVSTYLPLRKINKGNIIENIRAEE